MSASITTRFQCPRCQTQNQVAGVDVGTTLTCRNCDWSRLVANTDVAEDNPTRCLVCANEDLWRQKDFPQQLGMAFVGIGAVGSLIAWSYHRPVIALGILLAVAAIDFILFAVMPDVLVCYRCQARHSGGDISLHPTFNHETAERYRQEQLRREQSAAGEHSRETS